MEDYIQGQMLTRLYLPRQVGGRGLKEVNATIDAEKLGLDEYVWKKKDLERLIQAVWDAKRYGNTTHDKEILGEDVDIKDGGDMEREATTWTICQASTECNR